MWNYLVNRITLNTFHGYNTGFQHFSNVKDLMNKHWGILI